MKRFYFGGAATEQPRRNNVGMTGYPLLLDVAGRGAVVVGGGAVAARRAAALARAGARVTVVAPDVCAELTALDVDVHRRRYADGDLAGAWLAHAATDDADVNAAVAAEAELLGIWCVRADDAGSSAAWVPAVARAGDITLAVNAGANPRLAIAVRDAVRDLLPGILAAVGSAGRVDAADA